jgi:hypothetical protein
MRDKRLKEVVLVEALENNDQTIQYTKCLRVMQSLTQEIPDAF